MALNKATWTKSWRGEVVLQCIVLAMACLLGDLLCYSVSQFKLLWRAIADSATHGTVGMLSWAVVVLPGTSLARWAQCVLCGLLASVIDVDHFLQAGSLQLQAAVTLQHRPPFHSTSLVLIVTALLWVLSLVLHSLLLKRVALMCFIAWTSHHLRDATRRGLWFPPLGSTPPLPYVMYIAAVVGLSLVGHYAFSLCRDVTSSDRQQAVPFSVPSVVVE